MSSNEFIIKKCNEFIDNIYNMTEDEKTNAMWFLLTTTKQHIDKLHQLLEDSSVSNQKLLDQNQKLCDLIHHYKCFIKDLNLEKQYHFYSHQKGAI
ncbi:exonuclease V gamma subunit [Bacillus chungangensis]|uniref:Exonuclease V gamma subunit n=1 Tax=Bacillus chungangensis TaxID=587633 RepID=A0ABT9WS84_9BACI|nr:exonuclease V gamma subunit [Bacillus chungangensis]